jgi:hypothetical protein
MPHLRSRATTGALVCAVAACAPSADPAPPPSAATRTDTVVVSDTVVVERTAETDAQIARLQIQLLERDQRIRGLDEELAASRQEVVRNLAKLQSQASRAEAASGLAEAEIAVERLGRLDGGSDLTEYADAQSRLAEGSAEFTAENFGGALYLATQARTLATSGEQRLRVVGGRTLAAGETLFAIPLALRTVSRSNVRSGPGLDHDIRFTLDPDVELVGQSYTNQWVRIVDPQGREGWIFNSLVAGRGG